jgi:hypothetical protein
MGEDRGSKETDGCPLTVVGVILDGGGIHRPPGCYVGRPFGQGVCLWLFFSEFKVG